MQTLRRLRDRLLVEASRLAPRRFLSHWLFLMKGHPAISDAWGYHIRPIHYYEPLPDFAKITAEQLGKRRVSAAVDFRLSEQVRLLEALGQSFRHELQELDDSGAFDFHNSFYAGFDAAAYYSLVRYAKPRRVVEVGSGYSTRIAAAVLAKNAAEGRGGTLTCIEPYPEPRLTESGVAFELIEQTVQEVDLSVFERLEDGDVLFIDSSHVACTGSDLVTILFEILPVLRPGVWVHFHDIFFPTDYPAEWVIERRIAFNEQYLLEAFLSHNRSFSVQLANRWMAMDHPAAVAGLCPPSIRDADGGMRDASSLWLRKEADAG